MDFVETNENVEESEDPFTSSWNWKEPNAIGSAKSNLTAIVGNVFEKSLKNRINVDDDNLIPSLILTKSIDSFEEEVKTSSIAKQNEGNHTVEINMEERKNNYFQNGWVNGSFVDGQQVDADLYGIRSATRIRKMRKKASQVSETEQPIQTRSNQEKLALAVIEGNMETVKELVEAYTLIYEFDGLKTVLGFRYDLHPKSLALKSSATDCKNLTTNDPSVSMFLDLSVLHIACIFDQEQILNYFFKHNIGSVIRATSVYGNTLLHTCSWFGTLAPMMTLLKHGADFDKTDGLMHTPIHFACLKGQRDCVKALIDSGCYLNARDENGNTPLHAAALGNNYQCARELLNNDHIVDVNAVNDDNGTALHYSSTLAMAALLINAGADPTIKMTIQDTSKSTFSVFLETMPEGCNIIMNSYLNTNGKSFGALDFSISFNFSLFHKRFISDEGCEIDSLFEIVEADQKDILKHPVIESFMQLKWLLIKNYVYSFLTFYSVFVISITALVLTNHSKWFAKFIRDQDRELLSIILTIICSIWVVIMLGKNASLILYSWKRFLKSFNAIFETAMIVICTIYLAILWFCGNNEQIKVHFGSLSLFASWCNLTLILGTLPKAGIYIQMVISISLDVLKFMAIYASVILAFSLPFHILNGQDHENFADPITSILSTLAMMVGEFSFGEVFLPSKLSHSFTTHLVFFIFLILVSIIIMNLLIGLAISNITDLFVHSGLERLKSSVDFIKTFEDTMRIGSSFLPFKLSAPSLFKTIRSMQESEDEDFIIHLYPNSHRFTVFVHNRVEQQKKPTWLKLPPWIIRNSKKILKQTSSKDVGFDVESSNQKQEELLTKLFSEMKTLKKEIFTLKAEHKKCSK